MISGVAIHWFLTIWTPGACRPRTAGEIAAAIPDTGRQRVTPTVFSGLSYGKYAIQARERPASGEGGGRIGGAIATLDDTHPEIEVEVLISDTPGIVRVVDQAGDPIAGAFVKAGEDRLLQTESRRVLSRERRPGDEGPRIGTRFHARAPLGLERTIVRHRAQPRAASLPAVRGRESAHRRRQSRVARHRCASALAFLHRDASL